MRDYSYMKKHIGHWVQLDRGGPESQVGQLLAVESDYLVLSGQDGILYYYKTSHIKSMSLSSTDEYEVEREEYDNEPVRGATFEDMLENLRYSWIQINRGGPEKVEGVLCKIRDNYILLIKDSELIHISLHHVKCICAPVESEEDKKDKEEETSNDSNNEDKKKESSNRDSDRRSSSNRSRRSSRSRRSNASYGLNVYRISSPPPLRNSRR